jgi:dTDP-4-dehydrorhamnose reductase
MANDVKMAAKQLVWITGAGGLIGSYLVKSAPSQWKARALTRADVDLRNFGGMRSLFQHERPAAVIHCAAISKNPLCDADPVMAKRVNFEAATDLSKIAEGIPFIFLSTDLVFDGMRRDYTESDTPNPLSIYAKTKALAEKTILANPKHTVVRTSLNAGHSPTGDRAFNEEMRRSFAAGKELTLFEDEFRCPIPAEFTARAIWEILGQTGVYHVCGAERLSRFQIGELIAGNHPELNPKIVRGSLRDYKGSPRSPDTSMNCWKIQQLLSFPLPRFSDWVRAQPMGSL